MIKTSIRAFQRNVLPLLSGAIVLVSPGILKAEEEASPPPVATPELEPYVVSPTRFELPPEDVGNSVSIITGEELQQRQVQSLDDAIQLIPGVINASSGQRGTNTSIFLRGVNSNQTQFLVDGVRINDSNILIAPFLGTARPFHTASIEVLRGPQSALYGGEAIGGVVSLWTPKGQGDPSGSFEVSAGSFSSFESVFQADGAEGPLAWSFALGWESTDNDRINNDFEQFFYSARIDYELSDNARFGFTFRGADRELGTPGDIFTNDPNNRQDDSYQLLTTWLELDPTDWWTSRITAGWLNQDLDFGQNPLPSTGIENEKVLIDWRNTITSAAGHTTLFGLEVDQTSVTNTGFGSIDESEDRVALYAQQTLKIGESLDLTGGVRWEDYESFGSIWTGRGAAAWTVEETGTTLRASVGSGFRAPSFFELFAQDAFFVGNPDLDPEESVGWDVGVEQNLGGLGTASLTWFHNQLDDLIVSDFTTSPSTVINLSDAETQGLELAWRGEVGDRLRYQLAYTYLDTEDGDTGDALLRRPEHTLGFHVGTTLLNEKLSLGLGGYLVQERTDVDAQTFATIEGDDYFVARLHGSYRINDRMEATFRLENLFDEEYDEVNGFPGLGFGAYGGFRIRF